MRNYLFILICFAFVGCKTQEEFQFAINNNLRENTLDYSGIPEDSYDRSPLSFSDQGAWFSYGFSDSEEWNGGFTGPFLMTQENGVWSSQMLSKLTLRNNANDSLILWNDYTRYQYSFPSHLEQVYLNENHEIIQRLFFDSDHSAIVHTIITNKSNKSISITPYWSGSLINSNLSLDLYSGGIKVKSSKSNALGFIEASGEKNDTNIDSNNYEIVQETFSLNPGETTSISLKQQFVFENHSCPDLLHVRFKPDTTTITQLLQQRIDEKSNELIDIYLKHNFNFIKDEYLDVATKCYLTLQHNWRTPAGELKHSGVFPSYHYKWFHGFWAWDSWKHAVALSKFDTQKAKDQVRAMYDFMEEDGFIPDCVYRDTLIEKHNYRNTKSPLSAWAVWKIYEEDADTSFISEIYPKLIKQHNWWYKNRDHDRDSICEFGSTDGSLIAAKWESGMDNAVRFDSSKIVKNHDGAYSLDQESVDLNSFLFAEKWYISNLAGVLGMKSDSTKMKNEAMSVRRKIQNQFYDSETGWFYDTNLDGDTFVKVMGCEGWTALWAGASSYNQAVEVRNNMLDTAKFNLKVPFQTLSADHPKFKPNRGYWRGPNWLDQSYFAIKGLRNYGFDEEAINTAQQLIHGCEGLIENGPSIRENYHPVTGQGMEAQNFSWSAAHILLLMVNL